MRGYDVTRSATATPAPCGIRCCQSRRLVGSRRPQPDRPTAGLPYPTCIATREPRGYLRHSATLRTMRAITEARIRFQGRSIGYPLRPHPAYRFNGVDPTNCKRARYRWPREDITGVVYQFRHLAEIPLPVQRWQKTRCALAAGNGHETGIQRSDRLLIHGRDCWGAWSHAEFVWRNPGHRIVPIPTGINEIRGSADRLSFTTFRDSLGIARGFGRRLHFLTARHWHETICRRLARGEILSSYGFRSCALPALGSGATLTDAVGPFNTDNQPVSAGERLEGLQRSMGSLPPLSPGNHAVDC